jgi:hypothetical protein
VAFVNKQSGDRAENDVAGSGQPIDFDPNDPDVVKVHYDVSVWNFDQRAELSEALADADLPHAWDDDELVVPEVVEDRVDAMFEQLEQALGPFPIVLEADAPSTEFGLDEWSDTDRSVLTEALVSSEVPHRWEGTTVVVAEDAEHAVDDLLDAIEAGELLATGDDAGTPPPDGVLSTIFVASDRLAKDPLDAPARKELIELRDGLDPKHPPYGLAHRPWASVIDGVSGIVALVLDDASTATDSDSEVIGLAQDLRSLVRPYV